jgi:hypothetical protein
MNAPDDNTAPGGLRGWWAYPPRTGMRRIISPWEYRHLRGWARMRIGSAIVAAGLGAFILSETSGGWAFFGVFLLAVSAANFGFASWELSIARSESAPA